MTVLTCPAYRLADQPDERAYLIRLACLPDTFSVLT